MATTTEIIDEIPDESTLLQAASTFDDEPDGDAQTAPSAKNVAHGSGEARQQNQQEGEQAPPAGPPGLAELRQIASERAAKMREAPKEPAQPAQPAAPDLSQLADAMSGAGNMRKAIEALKSGDLSEIAKLAGTDAATIIEQATSRQLKGDHVANLQREVASLREALAKQGKPEGVMTREDYEEARKKEADEAWVRQLNDDFARLVHPENGSEDYKTLRKVDDATRAMHAQYAERLLNGAGKPVTAQEIARLANESLEALAQQLVGPAQQQIGGTSEAGATSPPLTTQRRVQVPDNRAAAEAVGTLPDFSDEAAYLARARKAAEAE